MAFVGYYQAYEPLTYENALSGSLFQSTSRRPAPARFPSGCLTEWLCDCESLDLSLWVEK